MTCIVAEIYGGFYVKVFNVFDKMRQYNDRTDGTESKSIEKLFSSVLNTKKFFFRVKIRLNFKIIKKCLISSISFDGYLNLLA